MDLIQDNWSPIYSVCSILIAIRSLLTDPNCASPANPEAAHLYQTDKKQYGRCAVSRSPPLSPLTTPHPWSARPLPSDRHAPLRLVSAPPA